MATAADAYKIIEEILNDKSIKAKAKVTTISQLLLQRKISIHQLLDRAVVANEANRASIIESMEYASKAKAAIIDEKAFQFVIENLKADAPRVKWESAKVIANTAHLFPKLLKEAVANLLDNTEHPGTVVRWSAAGALSKIMQCKSELNNYLIPAIEAIVKREDDNAIKKIYQQGLKKGAK
jgi:HEAT repeat protein